MQPYNSEEPKREQVRAMFDTIAPTYDRLNHILSFGIDRSWRRRSVKMVKAGGAKRIMDLAAGTGDMSIMMARKIEHSEITAVDLSEGMLRIAEQKIEKKGLSDRVNIVVAEGEQLPFADGEFDAVTIVFGIRNFYDIPKSLSEIARVLKPQGRLYILEFSKPNNRLFGALYRLYFHSILPKIGGWISKDRSAYKYLPQSVDEFPSAEQFMHMIEQSGFKECRARRFMTGVAITYHAERQ